MIFFWIILYSMVYITAEIATSALNTGLWLTSISMSLFTVFLSIWIIGTRQTKTIGYVLPRLQKKLGILLPMFLFPLCNLFLTGFSQPSFFTALLTLCTCTVEEVFFRGFLLTHLKQKTGNRSIITVSFIFALYHLSSLFSGLPATYTGVQIFTAFSVSLYYCTLRIHCSSLIPCIAAHFLTNITAGDTVLTMQYNHLIIWFFCSFIYLLCSHHLSIKQ